MTDTAFPRHATGLAGLDELLHGGIPRGNLTLIQGPPGAGKSTLGSQFLMSGAESGDGGVYVSLGEDRDRIVRNLTAFGWDAETYLEEGNLVVVSPELYNYAQLKQDIAHSVEDSDAERLFIDSITVLKSFFEDDFTFRRRLLELRRFLDDLDITIMASAEREHRSDGGVGVEEYVVDGVISMFYEQDGDAFTRYIAVKKMRGTEHAMDRHPLHIAKGGITVDT